MKKSAKLEQVVVAGGILIDTRADYDTNIVAVKKTGDALPLCREGRRYS